MNLEQEFQRRAQIAAAQLIGQQTPERVDAVAARVLNLAGASAFLSSADVPRFAVFVDETGGVGLLNPTVDGDVNELIGAAALITAEIARQEASRDLRVSQAAALLRLVGTVERSVAA